MTTINNSLIYKIISSSPDFEEHMTYYGSTKLTLKIRMDKHRSKYKNNNLECSSKKIFDKYGLDNCYIEEVEKCNCEDKYELGLIEATYIKNYPCCNSNIPAGINTDNMREWVKDYSKEYYEGHTEEIKEKNRLYRLKKSQDPIWVEKERERKRLYRLKKNRKEYYENHKEYIKKNNKEYYEGHTEEIKEKNRLYKLKKSQDPIWVEKERERNRLYYLKKKTEKQEK
jgi:hypothetical protein